MYLVIIGLSLLIIGVSLSVYAAVQLAKKRKDVEDQYLHNIEVEHSEQMAAYRDEIGATKKILNDLRADIDRIKTERDLQVDSTQHIIDQLNKRKTEATAATDDFIAEQSSHAEDLIRANYDKELAAYREDLMRIQVVLQADAQQELTSALAEGQAELSTLRAQIEDFRAKQNIINEEIMRRRQIEEQQDFYRICLSETAIDDIAVLNSIRNKLHAHELLDKLIYDTYVSKPVLEMVKRVLKGESPSGIYKITRLKTGEIYIGKSTDVRSRWQQHTKTAFGVGTIAHSILHTTMEKDGVQNFTFELLEEVPKDKLTEREKYWINFYDSKSYGLNEREG